MIEAAARRPLVDSELRPLAERLRAETGGEALFDAASRGRYATDASIYQVMPVGVFVPRSTADVALAIDIARDARVPILARGGGTSQCGADDRRGARRRYQQALAQAAGGRQGSDDGPRRAGLGARRLERAAEAARAMVPGRRFDECPGHPRRHGRQQLLRLAQPGLRQHGAQRARPRRLAERRQRGLVRAGLGAGGQGSRHRRFRARARGHASRRDRDALAEGAAPRRRLQPRHLRAAEREALHRRWQRQPGPSAGGLRRHPGDDEEPRAAAGAAAAPQGAGRRELRELSCGDGCRAAHRAARADSRRAGRPHDDRAGAKQPCVPGGHRGSADRLADAILLVEFSGDDRAPLAARVERAGRARGQSRPRPRRRRDARRGGAEGPSGRCARPGSTS